MTKKEVLYRELINLRNQLYDGEYKMDVEHLCRQRNYNTFKIIELQDAIKSASRAVEEKNKKEKNKNFLNNTEEGKKFFAEQNKIRENLVAENTAAYEKFDNWLQKTVTDMLGNNWTTNGSVNRIEIGLKNTDPTRNFPFVFGHSFDISFDTYKKTMSGNYGSMGSFDLFGENNERIEFITGMGKILGSVEFLNELREKFIELTTVIQKNGTEIRNIDDRINNAYLIFKAA